MQGSCTACLLTINKEAGKLQSATLGDSGFLLIGSGPSSSMHGTGEVRACARARAVQRPAGCGWPPQACVRHCVRGAAQLHTGGLRMHVACMLAAAPVLGRWRRVPLALTRWPPPPSLAPAAAPAACRPPPAS